MTRRLLVSYLTITAFVLLILEVPLGVTFARSERDRLTADIERDARVIATFAEDTLEGRGKEDLKAYADDYKREYGGRVVIVDTSGISVADSETPRRQRRDFSTRPEIQHALQDGEKAAGIRHSDTLGMNLLYVAVPVASGRSIFGAVRITYPTARLDERVRRNWIALGLLGLVVLVSVAAVGAVLARSVTRPIRELDVAARGLAAGDLSARAPAGAGPPEVQGLARQFNDMAARMQELVGAQRAFVADASHELRTPLTALRLRLENLESAGSEELRRDLEAAGEEIGRLGRVVDGLLALARAEGTRPERALTDVSREAAERVDVWQPLAEEQGVALALESSGPAAALAVPGAVVQVLDNLLANALEVAPAGTTVTVRVVADGAAPPASDAPGMVEVHVVDQGPGLAAEERARAFDRFWRGTAGATGRGSGLGLAIVAQLAGASGGDARLDAAPGGGLDAVVRLPRPGKA